MDFLLSLTNIQRIENLEKQLKERFEDNNKYAEGTIEQMQRRIDGLEDAVAHLMAFIAVKMELSTEEIENENGITDF